jgi:hypothetical protein
MRELVQSLLGTVTYVGAVAAASIMVGHSLSRRERFWLRLTALLCGIILLSAGYNRLIFTLCTESELMLFLRNTNCVLVFILTMLLLRTCYRCTFWQALFCATAGYCIEHLSQKLALLIQMTCPLDVYGRTILNICVYGVVFYFVVKRIQTDRIETENRAQIVMALLTILFTIFINSFASTEVRRLESAVLMVYLHLFSIVTCIMGLFVEFYQLAYQEMKSERDILKQLLHQEALQYQREKETIDVINIKCHDLKHQLHILEAQYGKDKMKEMRQAVDGYDSLFRTGCVALDTVLGMKNYNCERNHIQFTCLANGEKLGFLPEEDVYSLFSNILDNAIEAVEGLPEEKRIISLTVMEKGGFVLIHSENYFSAQPEFVDGLPRTTKADKTCHGFGSQSIHMLAARYDGICTFKTEEGVFYTDVVLPVK